MADTNVVGTEMVIGDVVNMATLPARRRRRGSNNHDLTNAIAACRGLRPGQGKSFTAPASVTSAEAFAKWKGTFNPIYRKGSDGSYSIGFTPRIMGDFDNRRIVIGNNDPVVVPAKSK